MKKTFQAVLQYLGLGIEGKHDFNIRTTGPKSAQLLNVLVTTTLPDRWSLMRKDVKRKFLSCLTSIAGVGALLASIRRLANDTSKRGYKSAETILLKDTFEALAGILTPSNCIESLRRDILHSHAKVTQQQILGQELITVFAGSRALSVCAEAISRCSHLGLEEDTSWLGDGQRYSIWLGKNIAQVTASLTPSDNSVVAIASKLLTRGTSLGYAGTHTK